MQILIHKNGEQYGPFGLAEIHRAVTAGELSAEDFAWTDGRADWVALRALVPALFPAPQEILPPLPVAAPVVANRVSAAIAKLVTDEQDPAIVQKILAKAQELLTRGELVEYIGVQKKPLVNLSPDAILLTNKRFMIVRPKLLGMTFQDHLWREVANVHMSEQMMGATISCTVINGARLVIDSIPKKQARRIYSYAQEIEELMHEARHKRELESKRAAAGGVVIHSPATQPPALPAAPAPESALQLLGHLKAMLDAGLIDGDEYQTKKSELLARM
jgi:ribosomal protein S19